MLKLETYTIQGVDVHLFSGAPGEVETMTERGYKLTVIDDDQTPRGVCHGFGHWETPIFVWAPRSLYERKDVVFR